jgi:RNA polymerase sigma factor (sigma-70 family)
MTKDALERAREEIHGIRLLIYAEIENTKMMRSRAERTTTQMSDEPRGGNQIHDSMGEIASRLADKDDEINRLVIQQDNLADEIRKAISILSHKEQAVLISYYIECMTWENVARILNYSERRVYQILDESLERLQCNAVTQAV